jgi:hypothetical protein
MSEHDQARDYIHAMIGRRTRISETERDVLHQLLDTPRVRARFPSLTLAELCAIADSLVDRVVGRRSPFAHEGRYSPWTEDS